MSPCQLRIGFVGPNGNRINMDMNLQWAFYLTFAVGESKETEIELEVQRDREIEKQRNTEIKRQRDEVTVI